MLCFMAPYLRHLAALSAACVWLPAFITATDCNADISSSVLAAPGHRGSLATVSGRQRRVTQAQRRPHLAGRTLANLDASE